MEENLRRAKRLNWILGIILGIFVIVCAVTLFGGNKYIGLLNGQIDEKTAEQALIEDELEIIQDSISGRKGRFAQLDKIIKKSQEQEEEIEKQKPKIKKDYEKDLDNIASDDASTSFWAIVDIFRQHDRRD